MATECTTSAISLTDVQNAAARIAPFANRTPVLTSHMIDGLAGANLFFKGEHLQKVGAFKFRGACNAIASLNEETRNRGVVTHSSGNHAQALALAAKQFAIPAHIVMPTSAPRVKRDAVIEYGGNVIDCEPTLEARETTASQVQRETGAELIHPYNDARIIAGQGTAALELIAEIPNLDAIVAPIGGGGLISGTCIVASSQAKPIPVFAGEPAGADDAFRSKQAGELIPQTAPNTIADGLLTSLGSLTWPFVRDIVEQVITVDDATIIETMKLFWQRTKQVIEPSAAVAVAAAIKLAGDSRSSQRIGVIISGGNVDLSHLPW